MFCCCDGGGAELRHDEGTGPWCEESSLGEPASEVCFEAEHVGCAGEFGLAGNFVGDVVREEDVECCIEEAVYSLFPDSTAIRLGNISSKTLTRGAKHT